MRSQSTPSLPSSLHSEGVGEILAGACSEVYTRPIKLAGLNPVGERVSNDVNKGRNKVVPVYRDA